MIIAHIDTENHKVTLISIPRDILIALPNWSEPIPKIKSTFNLGLQKSPEDGADMAMKYVSQLTGMPISNYAVIDFQGFMDAVNAVHGVSIDVPARLYDPLNSGADLYPGWQVLNGEQALAYVRIRQNEAGNNFRVNDFQRQQTELQALNALKDKVYHSYSNISELSQLAQLLNKDVTTNLNFGQIVSLAEESLSWHLNYVYLGSDQDAMDIASTPVSGLNSENYLTGASRMAIGFFTSAVETGKIEHTISDHTLKCIDSFVAFVKNRIFEGKYTSVKNDSLFPTGRRTLN